MTEFTIIANWKMNGSFDAAIEYADALAELYEKSAPKSTIVVCPPANLQLLMDGPFALGAQNCHHEKAGAFTGEISAELLADCGTDFVIIGHSERRKAGEDCALAAKKAEAAQLAGLSTIFCVGENEGENFELVVGGQLEYVDHADIIAYEPVWAIGTGKTPTLEEIDARHKFIKNKTGKPVVYGGSVNLENSAEIAALANVDGLLIGGASLDVENFIEIIKGIEK